MVSTASFCLGLSFENALKNRSSLFMIFGFLIFRDYMEKYAKTKRFECIDFLLDFIIKRKTNYTAMSKTIEERFASLDKKGIQEMELKSTKLEWVKTKESAESLRKLRTSIREKIHSAVKPAYLWFHTKDGLMTIGFKDQESWKIRYWYYDQTKSEMAIDAKYSCQTQFYRWQALVQDPKTLDWKVIWTDWKEINIWNIWEDWSRLVNWFWELRALQKEYYKWVDEYIERVDLGIN